MIGDSNNNVDVGRGKYIIKNKTLNHVMISNQRSFVYSTDCIRLLYRILDHHKRYNAKMKHINRKTLPESVSPMESFFPQSELLMTKTFKKTKNRLKLNITAITVILNMRNNNDRNFILATFDNAINDLGLKT